MSGFAFFGSLLVVAVLSALYFRRRALGTSSRMILSGAAVGLLLLHFMREHNLNVGTGLLVALAALVLGYGVWFLRREEQDRQ